MAYLKTRNQDLDPRFDSIATEYMRIGEELGVRWDFAFYQMIVETGSLSYRRGNRSGDVKPTQNNFAGLGATGRGEPGESFKDIASGVRAHLEHLMLYAGRPVDKPIAERTRKVHEWGVLTSWQQGFKRPVTYADLAAKWAPGSNSYVKMLEAVAERFSDEICEEADPRPGLVQEARARLKTTTETKVAEAKPERPSGTELARRAIDDAKAQGNDQRFQLGATQEAKPGVPFKLLNAPQAQAVETLTEQPHPLEVLANAPQAKATKAVPAPPASTQAASTPRTAPDKQQPVRTASAATGAKALAAPDSSASASKQKCRVWTASYGGQKAMIIRSVVEQVVNYTVLDVNEGAEGREADAFIAAYAKDGKVVDKFGNQNQALEKAFELCPEG